jgi:hypothetical protein
MISLSRVKDRSVALLAAWVVVVVLGILYLGAYAAHPGDEGTPTVRWLAGSRIQRDDRRPTLLIFLHPGCPCSRASLGELAYIMDRCRDRVSVQAILLGTPFLDRWGRSEIERDLAGLPDVHVYPDRGGAEARRFSVATSGHVLLYDPRGRLVFSGGITAARGHAGDNCGRAAVLDRILSEEGGRAGSPVFGCPLTTPRSTANAESRP